MSQVTRRSLIAIIAILMASIAMSDHAKAGTIAAAEDHTCGVTGGGAAKCWGRNSYYQLGDGTEDGVDRLTPVSVKKLTSGVSAIAAGRYHSCALLNSGAVKCWGNGAEIGDGVGLSRSTPVFVKGMKQGIVAIDARYTHTCALTNGGGVKCWGSNFYGELGNRTTEWGWSPVFVTGFRTGATAVTVGESHTCVLTDTGGVKCWGRNHVGQLGDGTTTNRLVPKFVKGLRSDVLAIAAGYMHTCALTAAGRVKCWGANLSGSLGDGTAVERHAPVYVKRLGDIVTAIAAGHSVTCALTGAGQAKCWGTPVGDGVPNQPSYFPTNVKGLKNGVTAISAGDFHGCAIIGGGARCWGWNDHGQIGDGTTTTQWAPVKVNGF